MNWNEKATDAAADYALGVETEGGEKSAEFYRFIAKVKADAWDEGLDAGRDRWMDSREFGDTPRNPYRIERDER